MLLILQSIIVYGLIIWVMTYFGYVAYKNQYPQGFGGINMFENKKVSLWDIFSKSYFFLPIFVFCLFAALRYRVGVDCESYKESFYEIAKFGEVTRAQGIEIFFLFLTNFTLIFTSTHYLLFFILALLQIVLYYSAFIKERHVLIFLSIALILTGEYWSWMNGMRQIIAACAFVASVPLLLKKRWLLFLAVAFIASLIHRSALAFVPIGFAVYFFRKKILNKYIQLAIVVVCFLLMNSLNNYIDTYIIIFGTQLGYNDAKIEGYAELEATQITFGFRSLLLYGTYIIAIFFSDKMNLFYKSEKFNICYNLFFAAVSLSLLFYNCFTINRLLYYITIFNPAIISYLLFYLYHNKKKYSIILAMSFLLLLVRTLYNFYSVLSDPMYENTLYKFDL